MLSRESILLGIKFLDRKQHTSSYLSELNYFNWMLSFVNCRVQCIISWVFKTGTPFYTIFLRSSNVLVCSLLRSQRQNEECPARNPTVRESAGSGVVLIACVASGHVVEVTRLTYSLLENIQQQTCFHTDGYDIYLYLLLWYAQIYMYVYPC